MVIRKCNDKGESSIDWVKSIILSSLLGGVVLWAVQIAVNADKKADIALTKIDNLSNRFDRFEFKLDKVVERK